MKLVLANLAKDISVPAEGRHRVVAVGVMHTLVKVLFSIPHVEEVLELSASERVVPVVTFVSRGLLRLLDIPENVVWNGVEDTLLAGSLQTVLIGILEILDVIILLTLLENGELLIDRGMELVKVSLSLAHFQLSNDSHTPSILILGIDVPNL